MTIFNHKSRVDVQGGLSLHLPYMRLLRAKSRDIQTPLARLILGNLHPYISRSFADALAQGYGPRFITSSGMPVRTAQQFHVCLHAAVHECCVNNLHSLNMGTLHRTIRTHIEVVRACLQASSLQIFPLHSPTYIYI
jgi:hypothetical protein